MSTDIYFSDDAATGYDRFIGRYQGTIAMDFADFAGVETDQNFGMTPPASVLDVGCGTGALTSELLTRTMAVAAVDADPALVTACRLRNPGVDVRHGRADNLPYPDDQFDIVLATLPIGAARDPRRCVQELSRVGRPGGTVALCTWDLTRFEMYDVFWAAARTVDPGLLVPRRSPTADSVEVEIELGELTDLEFGQATATASYRGFEDFWAAVSHPGGPAGSYVSSISAQQHEAVQAECRARLPEGNLFLLRTGVALARGILPLATPGRMT